MEFEEFSKELGVFIQKRRKKLAVSQKDLSDMTGMSQSSIAAMERGDAVRLKTLFKVFQALEMDNVIDRMMTSMKGERDGLSQGMIKKYTEAVNGGAGLLTNDFIKIIQAMPYEVLPVTKTVVPKLRNMGYCVCYDELTERFLATTKETAKHKAELGLKWAEKFVCGPRSTPASEL